MALSPTDLALRANLVTLSDHEDFDDKVMLDYSAGEISSEESLVLMEAVKEALEGEGISFYCGTSYRHLAVIKNGADKKAHLTSCSPQSQSVHTRC